MIEKNFKRLLLLFLIIPRSSDAATAVPQDESFKEFCAKVGGNLMITTAVNNVITQGAKCNKATFGGIIVNDQEEADRNCKHYSPFHMIDARVDADGFIECDYEALVICRTGFKQINGRCYRIQNGRRSSIFAEATELCDSADLTIYQHNDERTAGFINAFFPGISAIWAKIDANGVLFDIAHDSGPQYAIVYGTASIYNVVQNSLVKIPKNHYAMVMCEYTPRDTIMVLRSKIQMLSKYTHTAVLDGDFTAWRTFNHVWPNFNIHGTLFEHHQVYCQASLSVLVDSKNAKMFDPKIKFMTKLGDRLGDSGTLFVAPFRNCGDSWCSASSAWINPKKPMDSCWDENQRYFKGGGYKQSPCYNCPSSIGDQYGRGKGMLMAYQQNGNYEFVGARSLLSPMLCDVMFTGIGTYAPCPTGWRSHVRRDGSRACHLYHPQKMNRDAARKYCVDNYSANLAGWHSEQELNIIIGFGQGWFSMKKNSACRYISRNLGDSCYLAKTFFDPDDVSNAEGIMAMINILGSDQPEGSAEYCMLWHGENSKVHDWGCEVEFPFTCTMVTKYQTGTIDYSGTGTG